MGTKISSKSTERGNKGAIMPGIPQQNSNPITGDLSSIIKSVSKDIIKKLDSLESGIDMILDGLIDPKEFKLSASDMAMMSFVSGGQNIDPSKKYESIKTNIQQFTSTINGALKNMNKIITPSGMNVIVSNFNDQKITEKNVSSNVDYSNILNDISNEIKNVSSNISHIKLNIDNFPNYSNDILMVRHMVDMANIEASDKIIEALGKIRKSNDSTNIVRSIDISDMSIVKYFNYLKDIFKNTKFKIENNIVQNTSHNSSNPNTYTIKFTDSKTLVDMTNLIDKITKIYKDSQISKYVKNGNVVSLISSIIEPVAKLNVRKLKDDDIDKIEKVVGKIISITNSVQNIKLDKGQKIVDIGKLFDSILNLGNFDKSKIKDIDKGLRKILWMVEKPDVLTSIGVWNRGLISKIIYNVIDRAAEAKSVEGSSIDDLNTFFDILSKVGTDSFNYDDLEKSYDSLMDLSKMYKDNGPIKSLIENITTIDKNSIDISIENLNALKDLIGLSGNLAGNIQMKDMLVSNLKVQIAMWSASVAFGLYKIIDKLDKRKLDKQLRNVMELQEIMSKFSYIDMWSIQEAEKVAIELNKFAILVTITGKISNNTKDGLDSINEMMSKSKIVFDTIKDVVSGLTDNEDLVNHLKILEESISTINNIAMISSVGVLIAPLGILGLISIKYEAKILKTICERLNEISIDEGVVKNLKELTKIIAISGGILLFGAIIGKVVSNSIADMLTFTIGLSLFIAGTIKAYAWASKDIDNVIIDAIAFGKLLAISAGIMLLGSMIMMIPGMFSNSMLFALSLSAFIAGTIKAYDLASKDLKNKLIDAEEFGKLIGISALVLMYPSLLMSIIPDMPENVALFTVLLGTFITGVIGIFSYINKMDPNLSKSMIAAEHFSILVAVSALSLSIGAMALDKYGWNVVGFAFLLAIFVGTVTGAYLLANKVGADDIMLELAWKLSIIVGVSALSLSIGAMAMANYGVLNIIGFGLTLIAFVAAVASAYRLVSLIQGGDAIDDAKGFAYLVAISAATMLIGAFVFEKSSGLFWASIGFAVGLGTFIFLVSGAYSLASILLGGGEGIQNAEDLGKIIAISAATLLIGGLFMLIDGMPAGVMKFAVLLGVFVGSILGIYGFVAKSFNSKTKAAMIGLSILVGVSATILLIGGTMMMLYPQLFGSTMQFLLCVALMVGGMSGVVWALGKIDKKDLVKGELALAGIELLLFGAVGILAYVNSLNLNYSKIYKSLEAMAYAIGGTTLVVAALGLITKIPFAKEVLIGGGLLLAGIEALIWGIGKSLSSIAQAMMLFNNVKRIKGDIISGNIGEFVKIVGALTPLMNPLVSLLINNATSTVTKLSITISMISKSVKDYADLKIPIYEGTKVVGYRHLGEDDFRNASENVSTIVTTLGHTILQLYKDDTEGMFGNFATNFLGIDNPFTRVVKSCLGLGKMISKISEGVKDYADLKIPIYEGTKVVGYRHLGEDDFKDAAKNVSTVIKTLGTSVITTYKDNEELFTDSSKWHTSADKTPFGITVKACTGLGNMISGIAKAIKDVAELRIPMYDTNGKTIGYREMTPADFTNAGTNIDNIVTLLANSIITTYNDNKNTHMFDDPSKWHTSADKSPFGMTVKAMTGIGELISGMVKSIQDVANLKIQKYDANGNIIEGKYRILNKKDLSKNGLIYENIYEIMTVLPGAIMKTYNDHQEWFTDDSFWHTDPQKTPFGMVKQCLNGIDVLFNSVVKSIKGMLDLKLTKEQFNALSTQVNQMFGALPSAIESTCFDEQGKLKPIYEDIEWTEDVKTAFDNYTNVMNNCVHSYTSVNKLLGNLGKDIDMGILGRSIYRMIRTIPSAFSAAYKENQKIISNSDVLDQISEAFDAYNDAISKMTKIYKKILGLKTIISIGEKASFEESIVKINNAIEKMIGSVNTVTLKLSPNVISTLQNDFQSAMMQYQMGMGLLFSIYEMAPKDMSKYNNVIDAIKGINVEVSKVKNAPAFNTETKDVSKFTKSINSLDLSKAQTMTNLVTALDQMARRLGGLDKLTNTLANKLAVVLDKLVRELQLSAKTIDKADEMQKKRHEAIKTSIREISTLLNKPVEVKVKQEQNTDMLNQDQPQDILSPTGNTGDHSQETPSGSMSGDQIDLNSKNNEYMLQSSNKQTQNKKKSKTSFNKGTANK